MKAWKTSGSGHVRIKDAGETGLQVQKETGWGMKSRKQARKSQAVGVKGRELKARSKVNQEWAEQGEEKTGNEGVQARLWLCENQKKTPSSLRCWCAWCTRGRCDMSVAKTGRLSGLWGARGASVNVIF